MTPFMLPFSMTLTPTNGSPLESRTVPEISFFWSCMRVLAESDATFPGLFAKQSALPAGRSVNAAKAISNRRPANPF